ncbi:MAG: FHA domain-containing protein [Chloroflexota bacterium]
MDGSPDLNLNNKNDSEIPERAFLVVNGTVFPLDKLVVKVGRNLENDLVLNHPTVSRFHAEIQFQENQFILVDKNSSSGTFLNNKKITQFQLFAGDIILFAKVPVMFMNEGASLVDNSDKSTGQLADIRPLELTPTENNESKPQTS